jgi:(E)-4-hydroxy-3-methylbut-2-enyl-diphosphate synthase
MVESALEFLRIARSHDYHAIMLSMKSSNPKVMIQAYRLLVERMAREDMHYPAPPRRHRGGATARMAASSPPSASGSLLLDGLGDTIRVSLTEDSVYEIPVARAIADKAMSLWQGSNAERSTPNAERSSASTLGGKSSALNVERSEMLLCDTVDPYHFTKRETSTLHFSDKCTVGPEQPPRVIVRTSLAGLAAAAPSPRRPRSSRTPRPRACWCLWLQPKIWPKPRQPRHRWIFWRSN